MGICPKEIKTYIHTELVREFYSSIIHNYPRVETTQCPISAGELIDCVLPCGGIQLSNEKE